MSNEIKEILKYIDQFVFIDQTYNDMKLSKVDAKLILDCITNLQKENQRLLVELNKDMIERNNYLSRNEKAIEYIKECCYYPRIDSHIDEKVYSNMTSDEVEKLLNILEGDKVIKMINSKITTDIMTTTGFTINIPPAKVVINNQEITDLETFNKVVDSIKEKDKEIKRLNNIIDELILECYNCDMTFGEFKNIWKKAYNKEYNSKDLDKLKDLKEDDKND